MIVADHISKYYGARRALTDLSFTIERNEVVGFLGLNGAGKTTVLKILSGLLLPSAGRVTVDGLDSLEHPREVRRRIGFLPDRPPVYGDMTVRGMLSYAGRLNGVSAADIDDRVDRVLAETQLSHVQGDLVEWLSHGYRQRLGIAQAIVHGPQLVILDEPISGLDPEQIVGMRKLIRGLAEEHTVLLSSHILGEISQTCDRILVLHQGRIVAQGKESELVHGRSGSVVEVVARGTPQAARGAVETVDGVAEYELLETSEDRLRFTVKVDGDPAREGVVRALVEAGLGVRRVHDLEGAGLESVFLKLTRGATEAQAARAEAQGGAA